MAFLPGHSSFCQHLSLVCPSWRRKFSFFLQRTLRSPPNEPAFRTAHFPLNILALNAQLSPKQQYLLILSTQQSHPILVFFIDSQPVYDAMRLSPPHANYSVQYPSKGTAHTPVPSNLYPRFLTNFPSAPVPSTALITNASERLRHSLEVVIRVKFKWRVNLPFGTVPSAILGRLSRTHQQRWRLSDDMKFFSTQDTIRFDLRTNGMHVACVSLHGCASHSRNDVSYKKGIRYPQNAQC